MQYLTERPEATHFCLLTNMKKLEQISRNGLKKLRFAGWLYFFVWEQFDRQIVSCSLPLLSRQFVDLLPRRPIFDLGPFHVNYVNREALWYRFLLGAAKIPVSMFPLIFQTHSFITDYLILPIKSVLKQQFKEVVILLKHDTEVCNLQQWILQIGCGENR